MTRGQKIAAALKAYHAKRRKGAELARLSKKRAQKRAAERLAQRQEAA